MADKVVTFMFATAGPLSQYWTADADYVCYATTNTLNGGTATVKGIVSEAGVSDTILTPSVFNTPSVDQVIENLWINPHYTGQLMVPIKKGITLKARTTTTAIGCIALYLTDGLLPQLR